MSEISDCGCPEAVEFIQSALGLWDGRSWVKHPDAALPYPAGTRRAEAVRQIIEEQTGRRCWVASARTEFA